MKKFIKRVLSLLLSCCCILSVSACGDNGGKDNENTSSAPQSSCAHNYIVATTKQATCAEMGTKTYTCTLCGLSYLEDIAKLTTHSYTSEITKESTCQWAGVKTYTCGVCGDSYTEDIPKSSNHTLTKNNVCIICGYGSSITLEMSNEEMIAADSVKYILHRKIKTDNNGNYIITLAFSNAKESSDSKKPETFVAAPAIIDILIKNIDGETVYNEVREIKMTDFLLSNGELIFSAKIHYSELSTITKSLSNIYYTVYIPGYVAFPEKTQTMPTLIILPTLPDTIYAYDFSDKLLTGVKITDISYTVNTGSYSELYFTGEKTYDKEGELYSQGCSIGYKLYDGEDYLIDSGVYTTNALKVGEKFKNGREYAFYQLLEAGRIYRLEILNVG